MEAVLGELQSKTGVIGSLVIGENGSALANSSVGPETLGVELRQKLDKFSKLSHKNNPFDHIIFESEKGKILIYNLSEKLLVIFTSQSANPLLIHSIVKKNIQKFAAREAAKPPEIKKPTNPAEPEPSETATKTIKQAETEKTLTKKTEPAEITTKTTKPGIKKPETSLEMAIRTLTAEPAEAMKLNRETEPRAAKPGLEELGSARLNVNTSGFPTHLDLILHLRLVYGANRFLATRLLEFNGKEIRSISRETKMSVEAIVDFIEKDPAIFSIEFHR